MVQINNAIRPMIHKRNLIIGGLMLGCSLICVLMTILFLYVSNAANQRVEGIRRDYRVMAERREAKVDQLSVQVGALQNKLDAIPERTASKTVDQVKQVVKEGEGETTRPGKN